VKKKLFALVTLFALIGVAGYLLPVRKLVAQGIATIPGQVFGANQFQQAVATGLAGAVTNPASNFVINIAGGPAYFNGAITHIGQSTMTLSASNTYLIVWNGLAESLYAKQAVTGPGSSGTTVGVPTSLLFAVPGVEIPLATVVCNATACGNGGNGSITDARPLSAFPAGLYVGGHLNQASAGTTSAGAGTMTATAGICTAAAATTCVVTFSAAFQAVPVCMVTDQTTAANGALKALPTTTNLTITTASSSDVFSYVCVGNPN
jgi:hypothetical protein